MAMRKITHNINDNPNTKLIERQPGNGTRYTLIFTRLDAPTCKHIGAQEGSWLVSRQNSLHCYSWPFAPDGHLTYDYVMEKLHCNQIDASEITKIIGELIHRSVSVVTDKSGQWLGEDKHIDIPNFSPEEQRKR